ncbi:alpha-ribazole phosphatase [Anaerocolumna cellulosilytica]|uniref:Alpha-ribazole phosphatase n=1 Tax=Anaerocolumna cellulosilytica TaxID=433286 RepID=A0A6S6R2W1_9FIRM|nr:histidine phosphatase family protein [Anaerocolumna cellulosilytica]MBB5196558.1 putative phosphoglycerate mutase [Anaerocolumna cellulosilytica]BCJ95659.1 alpha-ribazole phosphatase [Anaerocolumna cellulosilytica]
MNIYLIRHGRQNSTLCNVNVELAKEGIIQAELLGKRLSCFGIDALYSSHLIRAVQTAEIVNRYLGLKHQIRENIQEISFGELEGKSDEYINEHYKDFKLEQMELKEDIPYPGGENGRQVYNRAMVTINEITKSEKENIVVITHGGVIRAVLAGVLGLDMSQKLLFASSLENTGITQLVYEGKRKRFYLQRFNDYGHLEGEPVLLRKSW